MEIKSRAVCLFGMEARTRTILKTLLISLLVAVSLALAKIFYGRSAQSLAFIADGYHSLFDATAILLGIFSVIWSSRPPDESHPYGHQKFETVSAMVLSFFLLFAAYEVGTLAIERLSNPGAIPSYSWWGIAILLVALILNFGLSWIEARTAKLLASDFLLSDSAHNLGDLWITVALLFSMACSYFKIPYVDGLACAGITLYLLFIASRLIRENLNPLVDHSVLDAKKVEELASSVDGVLHCHAIRSRGRHGYLFLDLNIHLSGQITLVKAHAITHQVEERLKGAFPGLVDVVIHTEPHNHPPCSKEG
jgi:cation diffusion facilitator family transporter